MSRLRKDENKRQNKSNIFCKIKSTDAPQFLEKMNERVFVNIKVHKLILI